MLASFVETYIKPNNLDALASVFGLLLTILGFVITIYYVMKSRKSSQEAAEKAQRIGDMIFKVDKLAEIEKTLSLVEDIKRMNTTREILVYPQCYSTARKSLINFRASFSEMSDSDKSTIQEFITSLSRCEGLVDKAKIDAVTPDFAKINKQLNANIDSMNALLATLRLSIGRKNELR